MVVVHDLGKIMDVFILTEVNTNEEMTTLFLFLVMTVLHLQEHLVGGRDMCVCQKHLVRESDYYDSDAS